MTKLKELKKELKVALREIRKNRNVNENKDLAEILEKEIKIKENLKKKGYKTNTLNKILDKFQKYEPNAKLLDSVKYAGRNITRIRFDANKFKRHPFTVQQVQKLSNDITEYMKELYLDGKLMSTMKYGKLGWRSGYFDKIGEDVRLFNPADSGFELKADPKIDSFVVYTYFKPNAAGGNDDDNNDCLYNCLSEMIIRINEYWETPESFKKYLGLKRKDKVPIELIPKIETKLKTFQINIRGDHIYSSTVKSQKIINLTLINEHYEIDKLFKKKKICRYINFREKQPLLYDKLTFECYNGRHKRILSLEEKNDILFNFKTYSPYILIPRREQTDKEGNIINITIEEEFEKLLKINNVLKTESNGLINLFKSGSYLNAAADLFDKFTAFLSTPDDILQDEAEWISESNIGALIFAEQYEGELYKYDVKSLYPYLMQQSTLKFPIKRGEFIRLESFGEFIQFGIYRCKISLSEDKNINKLFRFNKKNYYTSIALDHAKRLNLKIELIQDDKPNFLYYSRDKLITFNEVFKSYVEFLFPLKEKKIEGAKDILNRLWGLLCQVDKKKYFCDKEITIEDDEDIIDIRPYKNDEDIDIIQTSKMNKRYKTNYARLGPFLIAQGRKHMSNIMYNDRENIYRCQTDGFLTTKKIHQNIDVKIGELKYEGYTELGKIQHCNNKIDTHY